MLSVFPAGDDTPTTFSNGYSNSELGRAAICMAQRSYVWTQEQVRRHGLIMSNSQGVKCPPDAATDQGWDKPLRLRLGSNKEWDNHGDHGALCPSQTFTEADSQGQPAQYSNFNSKAHLFRWNLLGLLGPTHVYHRCLSRCIIVRATSHRYSCL